MGNKANAPNWKKIKAEYIKGVPPRELAEKYGVNPKTLTSRCYRERWTDDRKGVAEKTREKCIEKTADQNASDAVRLDRMRAKLIGKLERAIDQYPDIAGNRMEQSVTENTYSSYDDASEGKRSPERVKTVKFENDMLKLITGLEKLMAMTGYTPEQSGDDKVVIVDDV